MAVVATVQWYWTCPEESNTLDAAFDSSEKLPAPARTSAAGFTLLELLVILVIIGIVASAVSLSLAPVEHRRVAHEVERLAALFRLAHDEARVSGRAIAWKADTAGYWFLVGEEVRGDGVGDDPLRPRAWPFAVQRVDAPDVVFGREPLLNPAKISIAATQRTLTLQLDAFGNLQEVQ